ncbi:hypothetical protein AAIH70_15815 [Neorhizobium sp. BT27B]|uniref:hypothetical protein n=1 Tax=Neorhizobium sp. BT27B TaxID=3142625 RepID=UPI003D2B948F
MASKEFHRPPNKSKNDRRSKRLRERECAETYFALSEPVTSIGKTDLERLFASEIPEAALRELVEHAGNSPYGPEIRAEILDTIWENFGTMPLTEEWASALIKLGPRLIRLGDRLTDDVFTPDNLRRLNGAVSSGVERLPDDEKFSLLGRMLEISDDLSLMSAVLRRLGIPRNADGRDISRSERALVKQMADKFYKALADNRVLQSAYPPHIIFLAAELLGVAVVREHLNTSVFLSERFVGIAQTVLNEGNSSEIGRFFSLMPNVDDFIDLSELVRAAQRFNEHGGELATWASRVLIAADRRRRGED